MQVEVKPVTELTDKTRSELKLRVEKEFGHVEIVRSHIWAEPKWALLGTSAGQIVSFLNIVDRRAEGDGKPIRLFGLNNVVTEPEFRNRGYAKVLNKAAVEFMEKEDPCALGLLFCADNMISFYSKLGWQTFSGQVMVSQPAGEKAWQSNCMLCVLGKTIKHDFTSIHLKGLPW